ncbi:MAG: polysaccharide biosynthesis tyrosine autokinase [Armatimonadetes bacterium]|nr:polysaccharide biosynthesis tyrosine autokinase [Armatimonadota bacterium]
MSETKERILTPSIADLSYKDVLGILGRRFWVVVGFIVAGLALAAGVSSIIPATWVAESRILLTGSSNSNRAVGNDLISSMTVTPIDSYDVTTQIQLLQSQELTFRLFDVANVPLPRTVADLENAPKVEVVQLGDTPVVAARVSARTEQVANVMAQNLPKIYDEFLGKKIKDVVGQSITFVSSRITEEENTLTEMRNKLADYQKQNGVANSTVEVQITSDLIRNGITEVRGSEAALEASQAALTRIRQDRQNLPATVDLPIKRSNVAQIEAEKRNLQNLQTTLDALQSQYFPDHILVKAARAQVESQKQFLAGIPTEVKEIQTVRNPQIDQYDLRVSQAEAEVKAAQARLDKYRAKQAELEGRTSTDADKLKGLTDLERTVNNHELALQQLKATLDALRLKDNQIRGNAQSINRATIAERTQPNWPVNLAAGAILGLFLGVLGAIARDFKQDKVLTGNEATALTDSMIMARVPRRLASAKPIMMAGEALSFEAYRLLRTNILAGEAGKSLKTVTVTASNKGEGSSTVAGNLAVALAQEGKRTLLLEANMRDPVQDKLFGVTATSGLNQALSQPSSAAGMAVDTNVANLKLLAAGGTATNATEALAGPQMDAVLENLKSSFDYIVIDSPAAYTTADAHEVGRKSDGVVFVVESGRPSKTQLVESIDMLRHSGAKVLGLVINKDKEAVGRIS